MVSASFLSGDERTSVLPLQQARASPSGRVHVKTRNSRSCEGRSGHLAKFTIDTGTGESSSSKPDSCIAGLLRNCLQEPETR